MIILVLGILVAKKASELALQALPEKGISIV